VVPAATSAALPKTLTCPNCSTVNDWSENFCHECGQDLRAVRAGIIAAAAPPTDIVTDDMPYLETLDRSDEQLEYVLSRKKIVIGTAPGNDIVIDSAFTGYDTVSPRHAELRREGDGFLLVDLNSENGTYVNNARTGENLLAEGDQISFGSVKFVYRVP
jgi:pSer/pThr/pTyr-binding forkhead associated (FHA) protein